MLERKFLQTLINWKAHKKNECLLVKGARQIGKTFIIDKFGKEYYSGYFYLNFIENPALKSIFDNSLETEEIYKKISLNFSNLEFIPTLVRWIKKLHCPCIWQCFCKISGRPELNRRPLGPEPSALPSALLPVITISILPN